ncbi:uncharacterized protein DFL_003588 [Arthrobotrys flagrans]|uniref:Uncharacterized protein n=1 Tax=Arthrobotrys flagrans TaxID=97331 RepID=A0A437A2B9_ARTFL|nr:hypothetical protein DFL_003588 [Arthrobotrys flagrans]
MGIGSTHYGVAKNVSIREIKIISDLMEDPLGSILEGKAALEHTQDKVNGIRAVIELHKKGEDFKGSVMNMSWGFLEDLWRGIQAVASSSRRH